MHIIPRYLFCLAVLLATASNSEAQSKQFSGNPVIQGWYADPQAMIFGKKYWIFPTYSDVYDKQVFFDAFSSPDLITWKKHEHILDTSAIKWAKRAIWAPAIIKKEKKYYLFFGANDIQNDEEYGGIGVAVADDPAGPYRDHLGKPLIGKFYNKAQPIDQFVFQDADGKYYIIYGGWGHCNIARLNNDFTGFIPFNDGSIFREITPDNYVEGPWMFLKDKKYYLMWSEGGWTGADYSVAYAVGDSPFGPFQRVGKILEQDPTIATGAGHHSVIFDHKKGLWYIVYHRRPLGDKDRNHRETCIEVLKFDNKGFILPVTLTKEGVEGQKLD